MIEKSALRQIIAGLRLQRPISPIDIFRVTEDIKPNLQLGTSRGPEIFLPIFSLKFYTDENGETFC